MPPLDLPDSGRLGTGRGRSGFPRATALLVVLHLAGAGFVLTEDAHDRAGDWCVCPEALFHGEPWRLVSGIFVFPVTAWGLPAVATGCAALAVAGGRLEPTLGAVRLLVFYVASGIACGLVWSAATVWGGAFPYDWAWRLSLSAMGAASGTTFLCFLVFPRGRWFQLRPFRVGLWVFLPLLPAVEAIAASARNPVALTLPAHAAGWLAALLYAQFHPVPDRPHDAAPPPAGMTALWGEASVASMPLAEPPLDELLGQISRRGIDGLTDPQRAALEAHSRRLRPPTAGDGPSAAGDG